MPFDLGSCLCICFPQSKKAGLEVPAPMGLENIYTPASETSGGTQIDIIAVHGLGGHSRNTWTDPNGTFWLKDLLPTDISSARVWTFGYNANLFSTSTASIRNIAENLLHRLQYELNPIDETRRRSIIFICHSLGGLVVKKAILMGQNNTTPRAKAVVDSIFGIVFLGTPHQGSSVADIASAAMSLTKFTTITGGNKRFIEALKTDGEELVDLMTQFRNITNLQVISIYETESTGRVGVVSETSATLNWPSERETRVGSQCNHSQLARFPKKDHRYKELMGPLEDMVERASVGKILHNTAQQKVLKNIRLYDYKLKRTALKDAHSSGTSQWFLQNKTFQTWRNAPESRTLWVRAPLGSGKSFLSAYILEQFESQMTGNSSKIILYYFFGPNSTEKSPCAALTSILEQLLRKEPRLCDFVEEQIQTNNPNSFRQDITKLVEAIKECLRRLRVPQVFLFLDGLDECENSLTGHGAPIERNPLDYTDLIESDPFKLFLKGILNFNVSSCLKIFITSRPHTLSALSQVLPDQYKSISDHINLAPEVHPAGNFADDINKFLKAKTEDLIKTPRFQGKPHIQVREAFQKLPDIIADKAQGSFLIAAISMKIFISWSTSGGSRNLVGLEAEIKKLESLSNEVRTSESRVNLIYTAILKSIPQDHVADLARLFKWLAVYPGENMTLEEARIIIALEPTQISNEALDKRTDAGEDIGEFGDLLQHMCGPIIQVIRGTRNVQWFHASARDFILSRTSTTEFEDYHMKSMKTTEEKAHLEAAIWCIRYLSFNDFNCPEQTDSTQAQQDEHDRMLVETYPLLTYSSIFWAHHIRKVEGILWEDRIGRRIIEAWVSNPGSLKLAFRIHWGYKGLRTFAEYPKKLSWIHLFSYFGLCHLIEAILNDHREKHKDFYDPNTEFDPKDGLNPVHLAAMKGYEHVIQLLQTWNIHPGSNCAVTPLQLAIENNNINVVRELTKGDDSDHSLGMSNAQALEHAALSGNIDLIKFLIDNYKVDVNCQLPTQGCALEAAALRGHTDIVKYLIKCNAKVDGSHPGRFGTPLKAAAFSSNSFMETIRLLVEDNHANVNISGGEHNTALQSAVIWGDMELVKFLIKHGAKDCPGGPYGSALNAAKYYQYEDIVRILLEKGVSVEPEITGIIPRWSTIDGATKEVIFRTEEEILQGNIEGYNSLTPGYKEKFKRAIETRSEKRLDYYLKVGKILFRVAIKSDRDEPLKLMANCGMMILQYSIKFNDMEVARKIAKAWTEALLIAISAGKQQIIKRILKRCVMAFKTEIEKGRQNDAFNLLRAGIEMLLAISEDGNDMLLRIMSDLWADALEDILEDRDQRDFEEKVISEISQYVDRVRIDFSKREYEQCGIYARAGIAILDSTLTRERQLAVKKLVSMFQPCLKEILKITKDSIARSVQGGGSIEEATSMDLIRRITRLAWKLASDRNESEQTMQESHRQIVCTVVEHMILNGYLFPMIKKTVIAVMKEEIQTVELQDKDKPTVKDCFLLVINVSEAEAKANSRNNSSAKGIELLQNLRLSLE